MKKLKSILSILAIIALVGLYVSALVFAIIGNEMAQPLFMTSLYATIIVPIWIFALQFFYKKVHPDDEISVKELKKMNKKIEKGEEVEIGEK